MPFHPTQLQLSLKELISCPGEHKNCFLIASELEIARCANVKQSTEQLLSRIYSGIWDSVPCYSTKNLTPLAAIFDSSMVVLQRNV